jgi:hypothetical protein
VDYEIRSPSENRGLYCSIALDSKDYPYICYCEKYNYIFLKLKYAYWNGSNWDIQVVDKTIDREGGGLYIVVDSNDLPHISYYDDINRDLKYAYINGDNWQIETIDNEGYVGEFTSIALDSKGNPYISYFDTTKGYLKMAWYE